MKMTRNQMIDVLVEVARRAMVESRCDHPVDLVNAATYHLDGAAEALDIVRKGGP